MSQQESAQEFRRRRAVELFEQDEPPRRIAQYLGVCVNSIRRWVELSQSGLPLNPTPTGGRPRRISQQQLEELREILAEGAVSHGWLNELWTVPRVQEILQRRFGITYSRQNTWYVLTHYLGWTSQRPVTRHRTRNEEAIRQWPMSQFVKILKLASKQNSYIAFVDECGFMLMPTLRRTYAPPGRPPVVKIANPHGRISAACALTVSPRHHRANIYCQLIEDNINYNGYSIARFIDQLSERINAPIIVIWDCIPIHSAKPVRKLLRAKRNLSVRMLPQYAPELNPADKVWAYVKYARLANFAPPNLQELRSTVTAELSNLKKRTTLLHSFIRRAGLDLQVAAT